VDKHGDSLGVGARGAAQQQKPALVLRRQLVAAPSGRRTQEFRDFFDGPSKPKFKRWQEAWFWFVRFAGFVLGASLIAAFAGLTHGP